LVQSERVARNSHRIGGNAIESSNAIWCDVRAAVLEGRWEGCSCC
jgi:hypothetical protein